jgi:hypothetical protein
MVIVESKISNDRIAPLWCFPGNEDAIGSFRPARIARVNDTAKTIGAWRV